MNNIIIHSHAIKEPFLVPQRTLSEQFFKEPIFLSVKNILIP